MFRTAQATLAPPEIGLQHSHHTLLCLRSSSSLDGGLPHEAAAPEPLPMSALTAAAPSDGVVVHVGGPARSSTFADVSPGASPATPPSAGCMTPPSSGGACSSASGGSGGVISSPFARPSWQEGRHAGEAQPQQQPVPCSGTQSADSSAADAADNSSQLLGPQAPPTPVKPAAKPVLYAQAAAWAPKGAGLHSETLPRLHSPAKPPAGRPGKPPLTAAELGNSAASCDGLDGAMGPAGHAAPSSFRRLSSGSVDSACSCEAQPHLADRSSAHQQRDATHGGSYLSSSSARHTQPGGKTTNGNPRQPSSVPHSPRSALRKPGGGVASDQASGRRRQLSWDGGASPLGGARLLGLADDDSGGFPPHMRSYGSSGDFGGAGFHGSAGVASAAATMQREEPQFFDPSAHAMRLRAERSGAADAAAEWRGEVPSWHWAPQRAATAATGVAPLHTCCLLCCLMVLRQSSWTVTDRVICGLPGRSRALCSPSCAPPCRPAPQSGGGSGSGRSSSPGSRAALAAAAAAAGAGPSPPT